MKEHDHYGLYCQRHCVWYSEAGYRWSCTHRLTCKGILPKSNESDIIPSHDLALPSARSLENSFELVKREGEIPRPADGRDGMKSKYEFSDDPEVDTPASNAVEQLTGFSE